MALLSLPPAERFKTVQHCRMQTVVESSQSAENFRHSCHLSPRRADGLINNKWFSTIGIYKGSDRTGHQRN